MNTEEEFEIKLMISEVLSYKGMTWSYTASLIIDLFNERLYEITNGRMTILKQDLDEPIRLGVMNPTIVYVDQRLKEKFENVTAQYETWRVPSHD